MGFSSDFGRDSSVLDSGKEYSEAGQLSLNFPSVYCNINPPARKIMIMSKAVLGWVFISFFLTGDSYLTWNNLIFSDLEWKFKQSILLFV